MQVLFLDSKRQNKQQAAVGVPPEKWLRHKFGIGVVMQDVPPDNCVKVISYSDAIKKYIHANDVELLRVFVFRNHWFIGV